MGRSYGQYCPIAHALDLLGDRWTLLIIRDLMTGTRHFNSLERGLPGISRALLSRRLRLLQQAGLVEKRRNASAANATEYHLTEAGQDLKKVINALIEWGALWAFDEPRPDELNPALLMWWMRDRINVANLPQERVVMEFDFYGAASGAYWLLLTSNETSVCLKPPSFDVDVVVRADIAAFYQLWLGRITYAEAVSDYGVEVDGPPALVQAVPTWFAWSVVASTVRDAQATRAARSRTARPVNQASL